MSPLRMTAVGLLMAALAWPAAAADFYVAPDGDDSHPGTKDRPFRTLERARDALRELRAHGEDEFGGGAVILRGGRYSREHSFVLDGQDSGEADAPITYRAAAGETAILDGGQTIDADDFRPVGDPDVRARLLSEVRDAVREVDLRGLGITDYGRFGPRGWGRPDIPAPMELFLDGVPQTVARWPNEGHIPLGEVLQSGSRPRDGDEEEKPGIFRYNTDRAQRWVDAEDLFISGLFGVSWGHDTIGVAEIDTEAGTITTDGPHSYGFRQPGFPGNFQTHYYAVNLIEEIELPGEYYIDRNAGVLYFLPPYPLAHSRIQLSALADPFIDLNGTSHVRIEGLVFENARGMGIRIRGGEDNRVVGCTLRALGGNAVSIAGGSGHHVVSCNVYHTGRGGITLSGGDRATLAPAGHAVRNCDIHRYNRWIRHYNPAVSASGVGSRIEHNHMHHALHQGVTFSGNEHRIAFNEIHRVLRDISDMGSIYIGRDPTFAGNVIEYNFFHHLFDFQEGGPGVQAIFFDDDTIYVAKVFGNVFYRTGSTGVIKFHGGGGASIANNIAVDSPQLVQDGPGDRQGIARAISKMHTDEPHGHGFPEKVAAMNIAEAPYRTRYPYLHDTYEGYNEGTPRWNNFETDDDFSHFVNPDELDFQLREDSPLLDRVAEDVSDRVYGADGEDIAFQPIPFYDIGLYRDEHRRTLGPHPFAKLGPADGTEGIDPERVQLWWAPSPNADVYRVKVAADAGMQEVVLEKDVRANHLATDQLAPGDVYYWQVEAAVADSRSNRGTRRARDGAWRITTAAHP